MRHGNARLARQSRGKVQHITLRFDQRRSIERLAAGVDVEAPPIRAPVSLGINNAARQFRHLIFVDPERLGPAAHLHPRTAQFKTRIYPDREPRCDPQRGAEDESAFDFSGGFAMQRDPGGDGLFQFGIALARPGKADLARQEPCGARQFEFTAARHIQTVHQIGDKFEDRRVRVCLHGIMNAQLWRHGSA